MSTAAFRPEGELRTLVLQAFKRVCPLGFRNGIEAVRLARELNPDVILMNLLIPKKSGALIKDTPHTKLVAAIRATAKGKRIISPEIQQNLSNQSATPELSARQLEILKFVADGLTSKAISDKLEIGPDGINAHLRTIFSKLGVSSRTEAVAIALRKHLLKI